MPTPNSATAPSGWTLRIALAVAAGFALWFMASNLHYVEFTPASYTADFWPRRVGLVPHLFGGTLAVCTGLAQLWLGLTGRTGALHRALGKAYLAGVAIGSAGGFYLAFTVVPPLTAAYASGLFFLALAWVITTGTAYLSVRRGSIAQHREWMLRSYTVTFAFITIRLLAQQLGPLNLMPDLELQASLAWACWAVPLLLLEPVLQLRKLGPRPPRA